MMAVVSRFFNTVRLISVDSSEPLKGNVVWSHRLQTPDDLLADLQRKKKVCMMKLQMSYILTDDFPKPHITTHPETTVALRGNNVTLICVAYSSSDLQMTPAWRKDGEVLHDPELQNYAQYQEGELIYTTMLHLLNVNFTDEGRYQCVVSNHFGSDYSNRAKLTVNGLSVFSY